MRIASMFLGLLACTALAPADAHAYQEELVCIGVQEAANTDDEYYVPWAKPGTWQIVEAWFAPATAVAVDTTNVVAFTVAVNAGAASTSWTTIASTTTDSDDASDLPYVIGTTIDLTVTPATIAQGYSVRVENTNGGTGAAFDGTVCIVAVKR